MRAVRYCAAQFSLQPGDVIEVAVGAAGVLRNPVRRRGVSTGA